MQISRLVTLLVVAGTPALCKEKPASTTSSVTTTTTSTTTTSATSSEVSWSPQELSAIASAYKSHFYSQMHNPAFTSFESDLTTRPIKELSSIESLMHVTATGSTAEAEFSSIVNKLPAVEKSYMLNRHSEDASWFSSVSTSLRPATSLPTPTSDSIVSTLGSNLGLSSDLTGTIPTITLAPRMSDMAAMEKRWSYGPVPLTKMAELEAALNEFDASMTSEYGSVLSRLATESIDWEAGMSAANQMVPGNPKWDAQLSTVLDFVPTYAQPFISKGEVGKASIYTKFLPASAIHARAAPPQTPSNTPVDVFTATSMTPEQRYEADLEFDAYLDSFEDNPVYSSIAHRLMTEPFDETGMASLEALPTPTAASVFDARVTSALALYPSYARSMMSEILYAEASILSEVLNRPSANSSLSTVAANVTTTDSAPTTPISTSQVTATSSFLKGKVHSPKTKKEKHHGSITSRAALPRRTPKKDGPTPISWSETTEQFNLWPTNTKTLTLWTANDIGWTPEQSSAMNQGLSSIMTSFAANSEFTAVLSGLIPAETASWNEVTPCTDLNCITGAFQRASTALQHMPPAASKVASEVFAKEASLFSKVENMGPRPTMTKTRCKRHHTEDDIYDAELEYDVSMLSQPTFSSILAEMSAVADFDDEWQAEYVDYFEENGPMYPGMEVNEELAAKYSSEIVTFIATMPSDVQAFFSSVASDQASIISSVSAKFATPSKSAVDEQAVNTQSSTGASPTGKTSAASKEVLTSGALALCLVVIMGLL